MKNKHDEIIPEEVKEATIFLMNTDYIANKIIEYQVLNKELDNDYTDVLIKCTTRYNNERSYGVINRMG